MIFVKSLIAPMKDNRKISYVRAGKMVQWIKGLAAKSDNLSSIPRTLYMHMADAHTQ